jgi:hypothetical protein
LFAILPKGDRPTHAVSVIINNTWNTYTGQATTAVLEIEPNGDMYLQIAALAKPEGAILDSISFPISN